MTTQRRFEAKSVLVTGGGSGMGAAFCHRFASEGGRVAVVDMDAEQGRAVAAAIAAVGQTAVYIHADVTDAKSMVDAVSEAAARHDGLHVAVNNAGIGGGRHLITEFPLEAWNKTLAVNLTGVFNAMRAEIPAMQTAGGAIVNLSSITGVVAHPMTAAYVATKHGVIGLTKSAALEWGHRRIRINAVAPTWVRTPMTEAAFDDARWLELGARHAIGRCVTMEEVAALVTFLCSDEASAITGSVHMVDGGYTAA